MANKKTTKPTKFRNMMYVQQVKYLQGATKESIIKAIDNRLSGVEYAYILHDKDVYTSEGNIPDGKSVGDKKEDHIHIGFSFKNARSIDSVAKKLGVAPQTIEKYEGRYGKQNMFSYLIHATATAIEDGKHQYDVSEVTANFDYAGYMDKTTTTAKSMSLSIEDIMAGIIKGELVLKDFFDKKGYFNDESVGGLFYAKYKPRIDRAVDVRYKIQMSAKAEEGDEGLEVIYIQGKTGSGKTHIAKEYAERKYGDYFMTGSANDSVQDYMGESVAIFDDARPDDFAASDWLKLLDPYNNKSTVTSRFYNKYLAVDCIIITTTIPFYEFFTYAPIKQGQPARAGGKREPVSQFLRRFNTVITAKNEEVNDVNYAVGKVHTVEKLDEPVVHKNGNDEYVFEYAPEPIDGEIRVVLPKKDTTKVAKNVLSFFS